jgi:hypothetical protein
MLGVVLTHTDNIANYISEVKRRQYSVAKVVTGWGIGKAWDNPSRQKLIYAMPNVIVRTVAGDPSYRAGLMWYPDSTWVTREVEPWYALREDIMIEIGNEPDVRSEQTTYNEHDVWIYRWHLVETIKLLRKRYPKAKIIGPSPRVGTIKEWQRWIEILQDPLRDCDYLSAHIYGWHNLALNWTDTQQYVKLRTVYERLFGLKQVFVTEVGIHDKDQSAQQKIAKYNDFYLKMPYHWRGMTYYHYSEDTMINPEYAVLP